MLLAHETATPMPGAQFTDHKAPGHWLLARLGKRVLRPGGRELTERMLAQLQISSTDLVVEFAPGLGVTAAEILRRRPLAYTAVDRDAAAVERLRKRLASSQARFLLGDAAATGLPEASASVVAGEAMLSMQRESEKHRIVAEAARLLRRGGRYGIHELCVVPDSISNARRREIEAGLAGAIHHGVAIPTRADWFRLLEGHGFRARQTMPAPMHLLEPYRVIRDEGLVRALRILGRLVSSPEARQRVMNMRRVFRRFEADLQAIAIVAERI